MDPRVVHFIFYLGFLSEHHQDPKPQFLSFVTPLRLMVGDPAPTHLYQDLLVGAGCGGPGL